jgi:RsiW-degrading membrane proteinase PrsW (M82 family)
MGPGDSMSRRLRISGVLVISGLLVEALCLVWSKPIAFVVLACLGGAVISAGVLVFLYSLLPAVAGSTNSSGTADDEP